MAPDYSKHKNAELEQLLRARSLPHTGKKADLIARLVQDDTDKAQPAPTAASAKSSATAVADDEIDWDDDAPGAAKETSAPEPATHPAPEATPPGAGEGRAANPLAVPNQVPTNEPWAAQDLTVTLPATEDPANASQAADDAAPTTYREPTPTLPPISVETELTKRLDRARKYNLPAETIFEAEKALERFKKFGTAPSVEGALAGALDGVLPERAAKKRGRGEEGVVEEVEEEKAAKRQDSRRGRGRGRSGERNRRGKSGDRGGKSGDRQGKSGERRGKSGEKRGKSGQRRGKSGERNGVKHEKQGVSEKDRLAAEARKARFGATA
ncbi:hypothetical protein MMC18_004065 [Xylographa bjoerkii]|nr:hypothetical protein [Xylographa bjoerkii]